MPKIWIDSLAVAAVMVSGLFILVRYLETVGVFFPNRTLAVDPLGLRLPWEDVYFKTNDGVMLNGWFFKNPQARSTVLFAHGNAGNIGDRLVKIKFFYDLGLNVFIFDYRGYGKSEGKPSEAGVYSDAQSSYDCLRSRGDVDMKRVIFYGASLGGAVVIDLAMRQSPAVLVVESSITSARDMVHIFYPFLPSFFLSLKLDSESKVRQLSIPKLFIHSLDDEVVPFGMGRKLFQAAGEPKEFLRVRGGHNDASIAADPQAAGALIRFLKGRDLI